MDNKPGNAATKRRDEPEIVIRPGPYTLANQAEAILANLKKDGAPEKNLPKD
jgi:hypothetical protein